MTLFRRPTRMLAAALAMTIVLAACGGDDDTIETGADPGDESGDIDDQTSPSAPDGSSGETTAASGDFCRDLESLYTQMLPAIFDLSASMFEPDADPQPSVDALADLVPLAQQVESEAPDEIAGSVSKLTQGVQDLVDALAHADLGDPAVINAAFESTGIGDEPTEEDLEAEAFLETECGFNFDDLAEGAGLSVDDDEDAVAREPVPFDGTIDVGDGIERPDGEPAQFSGSPFTCDSLDQAALADVFGADTIDTQNTGINPGFSMQLFDDTATFDGTHWGGCSVEQIVERFPARLSVDVLELGDQFEAIKTTVEDSEWVTDFDTASNADAFFYELSGSRYLFVHLDDLVLHVSFSKGDLADAGIGRLVAVAESALAAW